MRKPNRKTLEQLLSSDRPPLPKDEWRCEHCWFCGRYTWPYLHPYGPRQFVCLSCYIHFKPAGRRPRVWEAEWWSTVETPVILFLPILALYLIVAIGGTDCLAGIPFLLLRLVMLPFMVFGPGDASIR